MRYSKENPMKLGFRAFKSHSPGFCCEGPGSYSRSHRAQQPRVTSRVEGAHSSGPEAFAAILFLFLEWLLASSFSFSPWILLLLSGHSCSLCLSHMTSRCTMSPPVCIRHMAPRVRSRHERRWAMTWPLMPVPLPNKEA